MSETRSIAQIEADISVARERLSRTVDELAVRAQPKEIARRQTESLKLKAKSAVSTPTGELNTELLAKVAGAVVGSVVLLMMARKRFHKDSRGRR